MLTVRQSVKRFEFGWIALLAAVLCLFMGSAVGALPALQPAFAATWERQWEELVITAKKEGRLVMVGSPTGMARVEIPAAFKKNFGITVEYVVVGSSDQIAARLRAERRAGQYNFDVVLAGLRSLTDPSDGENMLEPIKPAVIHPDAADGSKWKGPILSDPYAMRLSMNTSSNRVINTDHVKAEEVSWEGLLNPKWKGKISTNDPRGTGNGPALAQYILYQLGEDYFIKLYLGQKVAFTRDHRQQADWLARGIYPISLGLRMTEFTGLERDGFPVVQLANTKDVPGYVTSSSGRVGLVNKAPHPNVAKLFINWLVTKDGHGVYNRAVEYAGMRTDLDYSWVPKVMIPQPGWKYLDIDDLDYDQNVRPKLVKRIREILSK